MLYGHYGFSWTFSDTNKIDPGNGREDGDGAYRQRNGRGTVYVVAGVGSGATGFANGFHPAHLVNIPYEAGSCVIDISDQRLDFKFINTNLSVLDHFTLIKEAPPPLRIISASYSQCQGC